MATGIGTAGICGGAGTWGTAICGICNCPADAPAIPDDGPCAAPACPNVSSAGAENIRVYSPGPLGGVPVKATGGANGAGASPGGSTCITVAGGVANACVAPPDTGVASGRLRLAGADSIPSRIAAISVCPNIRVNSPAVFPGEGIGVEGMGGAGMLAGVCPTGVSKKLVNSPACAGETCAGEIGAVVLALAPEGRGDSGPR